MPELKRGFITSNTLSNGMLDEITPHIQYLSLHYTALDEEIIDYCKIKYCGTLIRQQLISYSVICLPPICSSIFPTGCN